MRIDRQHQMTAWFGGVKFYTLGKATRCLGIFCLPLFLISCGEEQPSQYQEPAAAKPSMSQSTPHLSQEAEMVPWRWSLPENWKTSTSTSRMRIASFAAEHEKGVGDVSLVMLSGDGGGALANVNRWLGQIEQEHISEEVLKERKEVRKCALGDYDTVVLKGKEGGNGILAAMVPIQDGVLYIKMTAPTDSLDAHRPAFVAFCDSLAPNTHEHP